ncbi:MAG TPA: hypothetical protein VLJ15_03070 [Gammaproteobacteria bacterium]|nr:hypothetical protein [Gammaproteobacteria bacterium]
MDINSYKKTKCLEFSEDCEIKLFEIFMAINKNYGATYMSYTFDRSDVVRFSFRTDSQWADLYHNEQISGKPIIELCPLDVVSRERKNIFIMWDLYSHKIQPKTSREIMGMREDAGLSHGLTLSTYFGAHHDAIAIATEDRKNDLAVNVLSEDCGDYLKKCLVECRKQVIDMFDKIT